MEGISLTKAAPLGPIEGVLTLIGLGLVMLIVSYYAKWKLVKNTHDFVIAGRKLGLGFGIAGLLSVTPSASLSLLAMAGQNWLALW